MPSVPCRHERKRGQKTRTRLPCGEYAHEERAPYPGNRRDARLHEGHHRCRYTAHPGMRHLRPGGRRDDEHHPGGNVGKLPYTALKGATFTPPTLAERPNSLFVTLDS